MSSTRVAANLRFSVREHATRFPAGLCGTSRITTYLILAIREVGDAGVSRVRRSGAVTVGRM